MSVEQKYNALVYLKGMSALTVKEFSKRNIYKCILRGKKMLKNKEKLIFEEEIVDKVMDFILSLEKRYSSKTRTQVQIIYNIDEIKFLED